MRVSFIFCVLFCFLGSNFKDKHKRVFCFSADIKKLIKACKTITIFVDFIFLHKSFAI